MEIDASEVFGFAEAMNAAPGQLDREMTSAGQAALLEGVGLAQEYAPVDEGALRSSIGIIAMSGWGGSYGTSIAYAWMREEGGTITGNPWLVFQVNGNWVKVRSVTQTGSHYMQRSADAFEPRVDRIYGMAVDRVLGAL